MDQAKLFKNIVRVGWISSVNADDRTARVKFEDKGETFVSGSLKILKNPPFVPAAGEIQQTEAEAGGIDSAEFASHTHKIKISPWIPSTGDFVLCIYLANDDGDGFVIGAI